MSSSLQRARRIVILGAPGSGKSTLARHLGHNLNLPVFHLDQAYFQPQWIEKPAGQFRSEVERMVARDAWIIDGNYNNSIAPRLAAADTVIFLDVPSWLSLARILRRVITNYGRVRPDSAPGCPERVDLPFLRYTLLWNRTRRTRTLALIDAFAGRKLVLRAADRRQFTRALRSGSND